MTRAAFLLLLILKARSLDLGFLEFNVFLCDRIVFPLGHLFCHRAAVLAGNIKEAGIGARKQFDFDGRSLGHFSCPLVLESFNF